MLTLSGSVDVQNPKDLGSDKQLARRAKHMAKLAASLPLADWRLGAETEFVGKRFNDAGNTERLGSYSLVNLTASTLVAKDWTLFGRVDNLADESYETAKGYATAGRTFYVGLKWAPN